jgi:hypothetical protein
MSNTSRLFDAINGYCKVRQAARRDYINRKRELETAHGSQFYADELEKARVKRESVLSVARIEARSVADNILATMMQKAGEIQLEPLTDAEMRVIEYLERRDTLSQDEVMMAANNLKHSGLGLELLRQMAKKKGVQFPLISTAEVKSQLTIDGAKAAISDLAQTCGDILKDETGANEVRRLTAAWHNAKYGGGAAADPDDLPEGTVYTDEADFYNRVLSVPYETFARFAN